MDRVSLDDPRLALALVEAQVGSLVEVLPVALLIADGEGRVLRANQAAIELLEQPTLVGCCIVDLLSGHEHLSVRHRDLIHGDDVLRVCVVHQT